jgi:hypothetical protein
LTFYHPSISSDLAFDLINFEVYESYSFPLGFYRFNFSLSTDGTVNGFTMVGMLLNHPHLFEEEYLRCHCYLQGSIVGGMYV